MALPRPQPLQVNSRTTPERITVTICGEIDIDTASAFRDAMTGRLSERSVTSVHLDLSGVTFMDSAGVHAMLAAQRTARSLGGDLILTRTSPQVDRLLALLGLESMFAAALSDQPGDDHAKVIDTPDRHQVDMGQRSPKTGINR